MRRTAPRLHPGLGAGLLLLAGLALAAPAAATSVAYDIQLGQSGSFQYSYIHSAGGHAGMAPYYPSGTKLFEVTGTLSGLWDGTTFSAANSVLQAEGIGGGFSGTWDLEITGGAVSQSGANAGGQLDFVLRDPTSVVYTSGSFLFDPVAFVGGANSISASAVHLWGNNWDVHTLTRDQFIAAGGVALGLDLGGSGSVVPEPGAFLVFGLGTLITGAAIRRRNRL